MRLGIDSYSLRWQGWDAFQTLEYGAQVGVDNIQFSERAFLESLDESYLGALKRRADQLGLTIEVGMTSFDRHARLFNPELGSGEQQLMDMARAARAVGSPVVRCLLGSAEDRAGAIPFAEHIAECVRTLQAAAPLARALGVRFAVENHGGVDLLARELLSLIETAGSDVVGACLDTGNPAYGGEDPVLSAEILGPYILTTQVRDSRVWAVEDGAMVQWTPVGQGNVDMRRIVDILASQAPHVPINLEIITASAPRHIPYLDPGATFWQLYPGMLARDFARFVDLARRGAPSPLEQQIAPPGTREAPPGELGEQLRLQQRNHLEASIRYARDVLGIGERGRR